MSKKSICIGKVIEITNSTISVMLTGSAQRSYEVISGEPIRIGGVGDFIKVSNDIYEIVNAKTSIDPQKGLYVNVDTQKILLCSLIGYFQHEKFFQGSRGSSPNIFDNVYTVTDKELIDIYTGTDEKSSILVGKYLYADGLDFRIDIDKFFASHILIVGNTGSGKSNSLNTIYANLFSNMETKGSKFLVIDTNGEYSKAFTTEKAVKCLDTSKDGSNSLCIPLRSLTNEDWKVLLEATEKTQYPIIRNVWNGIVDNIFAGKEFAHKYIKQKLVDCIVTVLNSSASAPNKLATIQSLKADIGYMKDNFYVEMLKVFEPFDSISINNNRLVRGDEKFRDETKTLIDEVEKIKIEGILPVFTLYDFGLLLNLEHIYRTFKYSTSESNTSPMITRFNSSKKQFGKVFTPYKDEEKAESILKDVFGDKNIVVCDVSKASKDIRRVMVTFLCGKLYHEYTNSKRNSSSLHLIVDEAHNYLSSQKLDGEDPMARTCIETFERIIKEGRKFSVFLTMSTQRPSDITSTLLSQAHNYVIHKLVNPKDIEIIRNTVPFIDEKSMSMLSILAPGQAIFSGTAFNRPNVIRVHYSQDTKVESQTIKLSKCWEKNKSS
ncbi:MAG: ATP-binding protein [Selenomonadales bacterium]|nr:ATP-binding protein [Selenomonadales bacterium]